MQRLIIVGNLTKDPETRSTPNGKEVCSFTVAVNRRGEGADYFRVSAWEQMGQNCQKYLTKGKKVSVVGTVRAGAYLSEGKPVGTLEVTAQDVEFLSPKGDGFTQVNEELPWG